MKRNNLLYLLGGTGAGAAIALLFASRKGRDIRNTLTTRAQEGLDVIGRKVDEGRRYVQESEVGQRAGETIRAAVERGKNVANMTRDRLNDSIEAGKAKFNESIEAPPKDGRESREWDASSF